MVRIVTLILIAGAFVTQANAQELTGTLKRIAETGEFRIGYVPDAPPMSYDDADADGA